MSKNYGRVVPIKSSTPLPWVEPRIHEKPVLFWCKLKLPNLLLELHLSVLKTDYNPSMVYFIHAQSNFWGKFPVWCLAWPRTWTAPRLSMVPSLRRQCFAGSKLKPLRSGWWGRAEMMVREFFTFNYCNLYCFIWGYKKMYQYENTLNKRSKTDVACGWRCDHRQSPS